VLICPARFAVFELPNELIHSILSHISPTDPYARFHVQYQTKIKYHERRLWVLRLLSMTCKAMRLRLLPWIWEHLEPLWGNYVGPGGLSRIAHASRVDGSLASSVKYFCALFCPSEPGLTRSLCRSMTLDSLWQVAEFPLFVECLESLPNLHTLAIGWSDDYITDSLKDVLKRRKFPQIKALILPPSAYPLLKSCCNAKDVDCVVGDRPIYFKKLPEFLASIQGSNVKQLATPLVSSCDTPSKWSATPWGHRVSTRTDRLQP